jgi:hypothetical protein
MWKSQIQQVNKDTCTPMFIMALLIIAKLWTQPGCQSLGDEWLKKMWSIYTVEHYSAIEKNKIMSLLEKWMELQIMLNEISQTQKDKFHMFPLIYGI